MLIDGRDAPAQAAEPGLRWWEGERFRIGWKGHVYLPGKAAGTPSVAELAARLEDRTLAVLAKELCGVFGLFVFDKMSSAWQVTVDNAGLYKIFHDLRRVSTSFLALIEARQAGSDDLDQEAVLEFLMQGAVFGPDTMIRGVRKLRHDEVLECTGGSTEWTSSRKDLSFPETDNTGTVIDHFHHLSDSFRDISLSADLTGGFDTRLIVCMLHGEGLPFELAVSGSPSSHDVRIAQQLASLLGRPLKITPHDVSQLEDELPEAFVDADGSTDLRRFHRDRQYGASRVARGIQAIAHGGGGAHFKDFFSYQDFPRYGSRKVNFERYYDLRIAPVRIPAEQLPPLARTLQARIRERSIERFAQHRAPTNNESYDRATFFVRDPEGYGRTAADYINMGIDVAMPYLDYRNIQVSLRLPPWLRFMNGWHRQLITSRSSAMAVLPTSEGYTASSEPRHLVRNLAGFGGVTARRVGRKLSQRLLGKAMFLRLGAFEADADGFMDMLRATDSFSGSLAALKRLGLLSPGVTPAEVRDIHVGRILTAGMLARRLGV